MFKYASGQYIYMQLKLLNANIKMLNKLALGFALGATAVYVLGQTITDLRVKSGNSAYAQDERGTVLRSQYGLCWRNGNWGPADAAAGCDGQLAPPIAKSTAPIVPAFPEPLTTAPANPVRTAGSAKPCDFAVTLANEQTFRLNSAVLSNEAKKHIDSKVISKLAGCSKIDIVLATGHTDRLGSQQYNQKISTQRADAVARYLKDKGVSALIKTRGASKAHPIKSCEDNLGRKKLVECLAPNRRVVVEARGSAK
jgi:OOP family OmpA-OmpF porin